MATARVESPSHGWREPCQHRTGSALLAEASSARDGTSVVQSSVRSVLGSSTSRFQRRGAKGSVSRLVLGWQALCPGRTQLGLPHDGLQGFGRTDGGVSDVGQTLVGADNLVPLIPVAF